MKRIELAEEEVKYLGEFTKKGQKSARAHVLLLVHKGKKETTIAEILNISRAPVSNIKKSGTARQTYSQQSNSRKENA